MLCVRSLAQALPEIPVPRASLATSAFLQFSKVILVFLAEYCASKSSSGSANRCNRQGSRWSKKKRLLGRIYLAPANVHWAAWGELCDNASWSFSSPRFEILPIEIFSPGCVAELHHPLHSPQAPEAPGLVHSRSSKAVSDERCGQL